MESRLYIGGKLMLPPPPASHSLTKQDILRNLDFPQLEFDYKRFIFLINKLHLRHGIAEKLQDLILECCEKTVVFMDAYPLDEANISSSMKALVEGYEKEMLTIRNRYISSSAFKGLPWRLRLIVEYSFDGITHFLWQFKLLINSYAPGEKLPHAPTDWDRKLLFISLVEKIQAESQLKKFPQYKIILGEMEAAGYSISRRTYSTWRKEWANNTIRNLVQK